MRPLFSLVLIIHCVIAHGPCAFSGFGGILASLACLSAKHSGLRGPLSLEDTSSIRRDDTTLASWWGSEEALAQERRSFPDLSALRCPPCAVQTSADSGTLAGLSA